jgi:hypothetical protein
MGTGSRRSDSHWTFNGVRTSQEHQVQEILFILSVAICLILVLKLVGGGG